MIAALGIYTPIAPSGFGLVSLAPGPHGLDTVSGVPRGDRRAAEGFLLAPERRLVERSVVGGDDDPFMLIIAWNILGRFAFGTILKPATGAPLLRLLGRELPASKPELVINGRKII